MNLPVFQGEVIAERRKHPRFPLKLRALFNCQEGQKADPAAIRTETRLGGLAMLSSHRMQPGQPIFLELYLPKNTANMASTLTCPEWETLPVALKGRVIWSTPFGDKFIFGIAFADVRPQDDIRLRDFLNDYELDEPSLTL